MTWELIGGSKESLLHCAMWIVLHQETFFFVFFFFFLNVLGLNTLEINCLLLDSPKSDPGWGSQSALRVHSYLFARIASLYDTCRDPSLLPSKLTASRLPWMLHPFLHPLEQIPPLHGFLHIFFSILEFSQPRLPWIPHATLPSIPSIPFLHCCFIFSVLIYF